MNINNFCNNIFTIDDNNNTVLKKEIDEGFKEIKRKIDQLIQSHKELINDLNPSITLTEVGSNMMREVYPNKRRKINNSNHISSSSQCFKVKTVSSDQESQKINETVIQCNKSSESSNTFVNHFIKILSDGNLNTEQIQNILKICMETFSKLSCHKKIFALTKLEEIRKGCCFDTSNLKVIEKQISSYIQLTFCEIMYPLNPSLKWDIPIYLDTFCRLLLNHHSLELTVDEWLSKTENSIIREKIIFFFSLNLGYFKNRYRKEFSWIATRSLYAYLFYSCHRSPPLIAELKRQTETILSRVEEAKLKLKNCEDQNKEYWLLLIEVAHAMFVQRQTKVYMSELIENLQKFQDNPNAITLQMALVRRLQGN